MCRNSTRVFLFLEILILFAAGYSEYLDSKLNSWGAVIVQKLVIIPLVK